MHYYYSAHVPVGISQGFQVTDSRGFNGFPARSPSDSPSEMALIRLVTHCRPKDAYMKTVIQPSVAYNLG